MHIVHVMTRMLRAGSEENILLTAAGQLSEGDDVTLVYGANSSTELAERLAPSAHRAQVASMVHPIRPVSDLRAYREMRALFRRIAPDVVHTHQSKAGIVGRYASAHAGVRCTVHGVHILPFLGVGAAKKALYLTAERRAAAVTDGYIHVSRGMLEGCRDHDVGQSVPHEIIRSGFDLDAMRSAGRPDDWREILGIESGAERPMTFVMLAALEPRKRHLPLLECLPGVVEAAPSVRFVFAGEGVLRDEIAARARALGIERNVRLAGYRTDPQRIIAMGDACLLASGQEGLPRSVLQYLTAGKPTLLFDLPGIDEIATHERNALIAPPDDWASYQSHLVRLATDPATRDRLAAAAAETDLSAWDWRSMGRKTTEFYRSLDANL